MDLEGREVVDHHDRPPVIMGDGAGQREDLGIFSTPMRFHISHLVGNGSQRYSRTILQLVLISEIRVRVSSSSSFRERNPLTDDSTRLFRLDNPREHLVVFPHV